MPKKQKWNQTAGQPIKKFFFFFFFFLLLHKDKMHTWQQMEGFSFHHTFEVMCVTLKKCHLGAGGPRSLEAPLDCSLNAFPMFAWTSGSSAFLPQTRSRSFRIEPAIDLDWSAGLRTGVGPWTRCCDSPQLLE